MTTETKDSGVKWIGTVPADWSLLKMKHYSYMKGRIGWQGLTADEFIDEGPYLVTGTDFERGRVCWDRSYHISEKRYNEAVPIQLKVGDLLVTKDGTIGKLAYIDQLPGKASLNSHLLVIRPIGGKYINRFLYWVLSSSVFQGYYELVSYGSTMDSLSQEKIGEFEFYAPSIDEQRATAAFLDTECAKIDSIIDDLELQIEVLQKYKKSVISHAITKGLDASSLVRDSGIEYIGQMPTHWDAKRMKYILASPLQYGANETGDEYNEDWPRYIRITDITEDNELKDEGKQSLPPDIAKPYLLKDGDVLFARSGATVGKTFYYSADCGVAAFAGYLIKAQTDSSKVLPRFLYYSTLSIGYENWKNTVFTQATIQNIGADKYSQFIVTIPPLDEQASIIEHLDSECGKIDRILTAKETQLQTRKKHKQSLVYEYVTGKKRVKEDTSHAD